MAAGHSRASWQAGVLLLAFPEGLGTTALVLPAASHGVSALMRCASQQAHSCRSEASGESGGGSAGEGQTWPADEQGGPPSGQPTGRLTLGFTSRHCCRQQEPARLHPESLLLPATR